MLRALGLVGLVLLAGCADLDGYDDGGRYGYRPGGWYGAPAMAPYWGQSGWARSGRAAGRAGPPHATAPAFRPPPAHAGPRGPLVPGMGSRAPARVEQGAD